MSAVWIDQAQRVVLPPDHDPIGLDTEFIRRNTFHPKLALVQVAHHDEAWLLDPLAYDAGADLRGLLAARCCVMHSAGEDMEVLAPLLDDTRLCLFDTQIAAALCGMGPGLSYQSLVASLLGIDLAKGETRSDWLQRPLSTSQITYAEQDVVHLAALHADLVRDLERRGRTGWHAEECARLVRRASPENGLDPQPQRSFHAAAGWPPASQARLRRILLWREGSARRLDKPRPWLLDDAHVLALAQQPPASPQALFDRTRGQRALRGAQRTELFELLHAAATEDELNQLAPIPAAPRGETRRAVDAMRTAVKHAATTLDLPPGLLCPRRLIIELVATRTWPADLEGWRKPLLEPILLPLLPD